MENWLTNTTILSSVSKNTATIKIIHSICATSSIFARSISTIVDILKENLKFGKCLDIY